MVNYTPTVTICRISLGLNLSLKFLNEESQKETTQTIIASKFHEMFPMKSLFQEGSNCYKSIVNDSHMERRWQH